MKGLPSETRALHRVVDRLELVDASRAVLRVLCEMADGAGFCWPSVEKLMRESGYSRRSVFRALRELEDGGHLARYSQLRDPERYGTHLPQRARHGQGLSVYRVGAALRASAGLRYVDVVEHLGLRPRGPQSAFLAPRASTAPTASNSPPSPARSDPPNGDDGTAERHPRHRAVSRANSAVPDDAPRHPSTENGKPLIHEERLVLSRSEETDETDDDAFLAALGLKVESSTPARATATASWLKRRDDERSDDVG